MSLEPVSVDCHRVKVQCQTIKVEFKEETDGQQERELHIKEEPEWTGGLTSSVQCVVKEEGGLPDLYAGHKVEEDLVLGPEGPQLPDSAFIQPTRASSSLPSQVDPADEPNSSASLEQSAGQNVVSWKPKPSNQIQSKRSTVISPFDEQLLCSVDRPQVPTHQFSPNSSLTKPYSCDVCMKRFTQKRNLVAHKKLHGVQEFSCDVCMKQFTYQKRLIIHKQTHTGEKPYSCDVCTKQFKQRSHVIIHKQIHSGEKPYSCDVCLKQFTRKSQLDAHKRIRKFIYNHLPKIQ